MKRQLTFDRKLLILICMAIVGRLAFAVPAFIDPSRAAACSDTEQYEKIAQNLLDGHGFTQESSPPFNPDSKITPGYPCFLAAINGIFPQSRIAVVVLQILLALVPLISLYQFTRRRFGERAAFWGGVILIADVNFALYVNQVMTETVFVALFIPALIMVIESMEERKWVKVAGVGLLLGTATLVRPILIYFSAVLLLWIFLSRFKPVKLAKWAVILGLQVICVLPWVIRNRVEFGETFYTTISDINMWRLHAAGVKASVEGISRAEAQEILAEEALESKHPGNEAQRYRILGAYSRTYLLSHPGRYTAGLALGGTATLFYPLALGETAFYVSGTHPEVAPSRGVFVEILKGQIGKGIKQAWQNRLMPFGTTVVIVFLIYGLFHLAKLAFGLRAYIVKGLRDPAMILFLLTGIYFMALLGLGITPRLRVPVEPLLATLAGIGIVSQRERRMIGDQK